MLVLHILAMSEKRFGGNRRVNDTDKGADASGAKRMKDKGQAWLQLLLAFKVYSADCVRVCVCEGRD